MALRINTQGEQRYVHSLIQNLADVPGGVTVATADLIPGKPLLEGTYVGHPDSAGICHVIKTAKVYETAGSDATSYKIEKDSHIKVGDIITTAEGKAAVAVATIDRDTSTIFDIITFSNTLGAAERGSTLVKATAAGAKSVLPKPYGRVKDHHDVVSDDNLWTPLVVIGTYRATLVPVAPDIDKQLPAIVLL